MKKSTKTKKLDMYDFKIIRELEADARIPLSQIAKKVRLSKETVNFRIKRLIKNGLIRYFYTIINASRLGYQYYKIFLKFSRIIEKTEKEIISYLLREKSCANLRVTEGPYDLCFVAMHRSPMGLKEFIHKFNEKFGNYLSQRSINIIISSHKLSQRFILPSKAKKIFMHHGEVGNNVLDETDKKIIKILSTGARTKLIDIARNIKADPNVVKYRMKKLEKKGIIVGYFAALHLRQIGREFVQVDIAIKDPHSISGIIEFFDSTGACVFISELLGKYDLSVELYIENDQQLRKMLAQFKEKFLRQYAAYDVSHIYGGFIINWSPFDAYIASKKGRE